MEDLGIENLLTGYEIENLFEDSTPANEPPQTPPAEGPEGNKNNKETEETTEVDPNTLFEGLSESVGSEENNEGGENDSNQQAGTSPDNFYSSIAKACKDDDVLPELEELDVESCKSSDDFAELLNRVVDQRVDARTKRVEDALSAGLAPQQVNNFEKILNSFESITEEKLTAEGEEGDNLRKQLMLLDYKNKGFSEERALRYIKQSFDAGTEIEDAKEALASNKKFYKEQYDGVIAEGQKVQKEQKEKVRKQSEALKKSILEDKNIFGEVEVDQKTRQKIYDNISKPKHKTEDGTFLTELQKYQEEHHTDFLKYFGFFYTMTDGFTNFDSLIKGKVTKEVNKSLKELENRINSASRNSSGQLNYKNSQDAESMFRDFRLDV